MGSNSAAMSIVMQTRYTAGSSAHLDSDPETCWSILVDLDSLSLYVQYT